MSLDFLQLVGQVNAKNKTPLNLRQMEHARALFNESMASGVDPRMTFAMAWQESTLGRDNIGDKKRGEDHALGSMHVLRSTARGLGMEQDWLKSKALFQKTGNTDPVLDAKMGVALIRELVTKNKATTLGDLAAGYNGGPKYIGKKYGDVEGHVRKVAAHMGKFFNNGASVNWKQPIVLAGGITPVLATGPAPKFVASTATNAPVSAPLPVSPPAQVPMDFMGSLLSSAAYTPPQSGGLDEMFAPASAPQEPDRLPFGLMDVLPKLQEQQEDPVDILRGFLSEEYDKQYQPEEA